MPPRHRIPTTDPLTRLRNEMDALGRPGMAGRGRVGFDRRGGAGNQSVLANVTEPIGDTDSAHLLVLSASTPIAPGGDHVPFDSIVAQHGFEGVPAPAGGAWVHPVSGVYALTYKHEWVSYRGGGTVQLELDGTALPEGLILDGTSGRDGAGTILYVAEAGQVGQIKVTHGSEAAQLCDAQVWLGITDPKTSGAPDAVANGVVSLGTQDSSISQWVGYPAGWTDPDAHWIWHTALVGDTRPNGEEAWFRGYYSTVPAVAVTVEFTADNTCDVWLNGVLLGSHGNFTTRVTTTATLIAGENVFEAYATNVDASATDDPAGFILSVRNASTGEVLFRTTDAGGWVGYTAEPADWTH